MCVYCWVETTGLHHFTTDASSVHVTVMYRATPKLETSGYATWLTAGRAIRIAHYDVIDDLITRKL